MYKKRIIVYISFFLLLFCIDIFAQILSVMAPETFVKQYKSTENWLAVNVTGTTVNNKLLNRIQTVSIPLIKTEKNSSSIRINAFWKDIFFNTVNKKLGNKKLLIYSKNGEGYNHLKQMLQEDNFADNKAFFLENGLKNFNKYYEDLKITNPSLYDKIECNCD